MDVGVVGAGACGFALPSAVDVGRLERVEAPGTGSAGDAGQVLEDCAREFDEARLVEELPAKAQRAAACGAFRQAAPEAQALRAFLRCHGCPGSSVPPSMASGAIA